MTYDQNRREAIIARDGKHCRYCGDDITAMETEGTFTIDHVVPVARGGSHARSNLVVACAPCNRTKADWLLNEIGWVLFPPRYDELEPEAIPSEQDAWSWTVEQVENARRHCKNTRGLSGKGWGSLNPSDTAGIPEARLEELAGQRREHQRQREAHLTQRPFADLADQVAVRPIPGADLCEECHGAIPDGRKRFCSLGCSREATVRSRRREAS